MQRLNQITPQFLINTLGDEKFPTVLSEDLFPHHAIIKLARQDPRSIFNAKVLVQGTYKEILCQSEREKRNYNLMKMRQTCVHDLEVNAPAVREEKSYSAPLCLDESDPLEMLLLFEFIAGPRELPDVPFPKSIGAIPGM